MTIPFLMAEKPLDLTLELAPKARFDVVDLRSHFSAEHEALGAYDHCLYWSFHTTAGFLDRSLAARLSSERIPGYVDAFRALFPEASGGAPARPRQTREPAPAPPAAGAPK